MMFCFGSFAIAEPLQTAEKLASGKFSGWTYGSDANKKQIDCTQFLVAVIEEELKRSVISKARNAVNIYPAPSDLKKAVEDEIELTRGVQYALVDILGVAERVPLEEAEAGDFIQYWMQRKDGSWWGHSAIISRVWKDDDDNTRAEVYGAHKSTNGIAKTDFNGVGLNLTGSERKIYLARLR